MHCCFIIRHSPGSEAEDLKSQASAVTMACDGQTMQPFNVTTVKIVAYASNLREESWLSSRGPEPIKYPMTRLVNRIWYGLRV